MAIKRIQWLVSVVAVMLVTTTMTRVVTAEKCREEVTSFSGCLSYVSDPPNNLTEVASEKCCNAFSSAVESQCLCRFLRDPLILGFPLNTTRILSLSSLCPSQTPFSITSLCSTQSVALSPLIAPSESHLVPDFAAIGGGRSGSGSSGRSGSGSGSSGKSGSGSGSRSGSGSDSDSGSDLGSGSRSRPGSNVWLNGGGGVRNYTNRTSRNTFPSSPFLFFIALSFLYSY